MTGRPSLFTQEIADLICERIGTTPRGLDFICDNDELLPSASTVHRWLNGDAAFCESYRRARERQADLIFDECLEIADDGSNDTKLLKRGDGSETEVCNAEWISRSKLRVDTRLRMAGKLSPKKYGDKLEVDHTGSIGSLSPEERTARIAKIKAELKAED